MPFPSACNRLGAHQLKGVGNISKSSAYSRVSWVFEAAETIAVC